jgi:hypothetical protein
MRKMFLLLFLAATIITSAQEKTLYSGTMVKPKIGQATAFENAWKAHVAKFHNGDSKRSVFEIISGEFTGWYQLMDGPHDYADMDKVNAKQSAHDIDYETTVASRVAEEMGVTTYRFIDTLSYNPGVQADKFVYSVYNVKQGKMGDLRAEIRRGRAVNMAIQSPSSTVVLIKQMQGMSPQLIVVSNLKDGFKQLESNYFPGVSDKFRAEYIKMHGQELWDKRGAMFSENCNSIDVMMVKRRADLGSKL